MVGRLRREAQLFRQQSWLHIHESRGAQKAGRTLIVNPGSDYSEGVLMGVIIMLDKKKIKDYVFTSG